MVRKKGSSTLNGASTVCSVILPHLPTNYPVLRIKNESAYRVCVHIYQNYPQRVTRVSPYPKCAIQFSTQFGRSASRENLRRF